MKKQDWDPLEPEVPEKKKIKSGQPDWEFVSNIGDEHPLDHGGYFIYRDKTGVYEEEAELLVVDEGPRGRPAYTIYRVPLERMALVNGYLVPYKFRPSWPNLVEKYDAWFHRDLGKVAESTGITKEQLVKAFTSTDPLVRAEAYSMVGDYHGWENLDSYPLTNLSRATVEKRYAEVVGRGRR